MDLAHAGGSGNKSERHLKFVDRSGSSKNSLTHFASAVTYEKGSSEHSEPLSGVTNKKGSSNPFEIRTGILDKLRSNNDFGAQPEFINGAENGNYSEIIDRKDSSKHLPVHSNAIIGKDDAASPTKTFRSSSSSFSSSISSASSREDLLQLNIDVLRSSTSATSPPARQENTAGNSIKSEESDNGFSGATSSSQVSVVTHESIGPTPSPVQSPLVQVMDRSGRFDRISSSVFERSKSVKEWSVASNESLFSIHIGNTSFSRDHFIYTESQKSAECIKSGELIDFSPPLPLLESGTDRKKDQMEKIGETRLLDNTIMDATGPEYVESRSPPIVSWDSSNIYNNSGGSSTGSCCRNKCAWPSCHCFRCSWVFCCCRWPSCCCCRLPSCHCRWPSCHCFNCSWAFCCFWNCRRKRRLAKGSTGGPVKEDSEEQNPKSASRASSGLVTNKWFPCLPFCSRCCSRCCFCHYCYCC